MGCTVLDLPSVIRYGEAVEAGPLPGSVARRTTVSQELIEPGPSCPTATTQEGLAKVVGVHPMTVSRWERETVERRLQARRLDTPWIFHRTCKGQPGQQIYDISDMWAAALKAARLPEGRLFHDLRRSAVCTLVKAGVDRGQAMRISGHRTEAMFKRYADIFTDEDTAEALLKAEAWLGTQPTERNVSEMPAAKKGAAK